MQEIYDESKTIAPYVLIAQPRRNLEETAAQNFDGYDGLHIDLIWMKLSARGGRGGGGEGKSRRGGTRSR